MTVLTIVVPLIASFQYLRYYYVSISIAIPQVSFILEADLDDADLTSEHIRAARALLRWEQKHLAKESGVSLPSIKRLETQPGRLSAQDATLASLRQALERAGIEFQNGGNPGVRLVRTKSNKR